MTMPGMLDQSKKPRRRDAHSKFIAKMFAVGITAALLGGGLAVVQNAPEANGSSQSQINAYIRSKGGIPPCKYEDGSGQPGLCYWDGSKRGNKKGAQIVNVPTKPGHDKRAVILKK